MHLEHPPAPLLKERSKMKMKKRVLSLLLCAAVLMTVFSGLPQNTMSISAKAATSEAIADDTDESTVSTGSWTPVSNQDAYQGGFSTASAGTFTWSIQVPKDAHYEICWYGAGFFNNNQYASNVEYTLSQEGEAKEMWNTTQRLAIGWHPLGQMDLKQGEATLTLAAASGNAGKLVADAMRLQEILVEGESVLTVDNTDPSVQKSGADSNWANHTGDGSIGDSYFSCTGAGSDSTYFVWPLAPMNVGYWKVEVYIPDIADKSNLNSQVAYSVLHDNEEESITVDQTEAAGWTELGTWYFAADGEESVKLLPGSGNVEWALVDAVRITYMGKVDPGLIRVIVDNTDTDQVIIGGTWHDSPTPGTTPGWQGASKYRSGYVGENYYSLRGGDDSTFTWKFQVPKTGYYRISINIADGTSGSVSTAVRYELQTDSGVKNATLSHAQPAGYYSLGCFPLTEGDELQPVVKLIGPERVESCMVDAAMLEFVGTEPVAETGRYQIDLSDPQQTIWGLGVEIQSDSIASGNNGLPDEPNSVPHDLIPEERERFYSDMLSGFRYMRLAGGLFYRGTDEDGKHLQGRWEEQDAELAELIEKSGIEGFNLEFWSPTPYFKANGKYPINGEPNNQLKMLRCYGPDFADDPVYHSDQGKFLNDFADTLVEDFQRMRAAGLPLVQFSLQNEPPLTSVSGAYSHCYYTPQAYYETCQVVLPKLKAAFPDLFIHATSWNGQNASESQLIKQNAELLQCIDGWSFHCVGANSNKPIDELNSLTSGTAGRPVISTEFEYQPNNFSGQPEFRFVNTAQMIMNWMTFENSPTFYWLHALKPLGNAESLGYGLGFWRKPGDTATYEVCNHVEEGHWDYNYQNWNSFRGFLEHMPWNSVRYTVKEDKVRKDQRIMAWKSPEGKLAFALTNRSSTNPFSFKVNTGLEGKTFHGYRLTADSEEENYLGTKTGGEISTTLEPYSIEFWVQDEDGTMTMADGVELSETELELPLNGTAQLEATVTPEDAANKNVTWTSDDSTIAKVDENGNVTPIREGETKIIATAVSGNGRYKAECTVTVVSEAEEHELLVQAGEGGTAQILDVGESGNYPAGSQVTVKAEADEGYVFDEWESSDGGSFADEKAAQTVFNMPDNDVTVTARFKEEQAGDEPELNLSELALKVGESYQLEVSNIDEGTEVAWSSSDDEKVSVSDTGLVEALAKGAATITADVGGTALTCEVTVTEEGTPTPELSKTKLSLKVGASSRLTVRNLPEGAEVTWRSDHPRIATVSDMGVVKGIRKGKTTVTADVDGTKLTCEVTVTARSSGGNADPHPSRKQIVIPVKSPEPEKPKTGGSLYLDTKTYEMSPNDIYDIDCDLQGYDLQNLRIYSSRSHIAKVERLSNGRYRITGLDSGVTYIMFEVYDDSGTLLTHASVRVTVAQGAQARGEKNFEASTF